MYAIDIYITSIHKIRRDDRDGPASCFCRKTAKFFYSIVLPQRDNLSVYNKFCWCPHALLCFTMYSLKSLIRTFLCFDMSHDKLRVRKNFKKFREEQAQGNVKNHFFTTRLKLNLHPKYNRGNEIAESTIFIKSLDVFNHIYGPFRKNKKNSYQFKQIYKNDAILKN